GIHSFEYIPQIKSAFLVANQLRTIRLIEILSGLDLFNRSSGRKNFLQIIHNAALSSEIAQALLHFLAGANSTAKVKVEARLHTAT
ncbi:hypothetical protein ACVUQZ_006603, partial [Pseudomonas aeruginosa]